MYKNTEYSDMVNMRTNFQSLEEGISIINFSERLNEVHQLLAEQAIQFAVVTSTHNIFYLTGFYTDPHERFLALALDTRTSSSILFVPGLDMELAAQAKGIAKIIPVSDTDDPYRLLQKEFDLRHVDRIGLEHQIISLGRAQRIQALVPDASCQDVDPVLAGLRIVKSKDEISLVRKAIELAENALEQSIQKAAIGMSELELVSEIDYQIRRLGGERPAFSTTVLAGRRSALPHGKSGEYRLAENEFLLIDMGVFKDGYCSDITRTFLIGEGTPKQAGIYETVKAANHSATAAVAAGVTLQSIDRAARDIIEEAGYGSHFNHRIGHGLGLEIHEEPSIHGRNNSLVETGMLFTIEPGIYLPELGGVRIEDNVWIDPDGRAQVLTSYPQQLRRL